MLPAISKVAVIGSGVMGSQIAAHIANAGVPVLLFDKVPGDEPDRSAPAKEALQKLKRAEPSPFMHPRNADLIVAGNIEDDGEQLRGADWIIEAIIEKTSVKRELFRKIDALRKPGSIVSSGTGMTPLARLVEGQSPSFERDFVIAHFFNPVRFMRLLEIVVGSQTRPDAVDVIRDFCDRKLGKSVISCRDMPGFAANRLGTFWMQSVLNAAMDLGLTVGEADEVCGKLMGVPRTGVFGLMDLIGLDLARAIARNLAASLPPDDPYSQIYREPPLLAKMIDDGLTGRKGKGGFYRFAETDAGRVRESINLQTGAYAIFNGEGNPIVRAAGKNLRALCEAPDKVGKFAWRVLSETLCYAFRLVPQTVASIPDVDESMRLGFGWHCGPFELLDKLGASWVIERLVKEDRLVPEMLDKAANQPFYRDEGGRRQFFTFDGSYAPIRRPTGVLLLGDVKRAGTSVAENGSAALWDIGGGVLCLELKTKGGAIDERVLDMLDQARATIGDGRGPWKGLVIHGEGRNFSVGASVDFFNDHIKAGRFEAIESLMRKGQAAFRALRFAPFPSVAVVKGVANGVGCELAMHCSAIQAYAETRMGFVDANIGLIPATGGCVQMLGRAFEYQKKAGSDQSPVVQVFETMTRARMAATAAMAVDRLFLRPTDGITMNLDRLLYDAKQKVLDLATEYKPPLPRSFALPGKAGLAALEVKIESDRQKGEILPHDVAIRKSLAFVLSGGEGAGSGPLGEEAIMALELQEFMKLIRMPETSARLHVLRTG